MLDWRKRVEERLDELRLDPEGRDAIVAEVLSHLEELYNDAIASGSVENDAERVVFAELERTDILRDGLKEAGIASSEPAFLITFRRWPMLDSLSQDLRYALRSITRRPAFSLLVAATMTLGIGASTAMFSVVDAVLLRPLPYKEPDRLVLAMARETRSSGPSKLFAPYADIAEWHRSNKTFEQLEACTWVRPPATFNWHGATGKVLAIPVTRGFFSLLGVRSEMGRTFDPQDGRDPNEGAVVVSHGFWQGRLGGSRDAVGKSVIIDDKNCVIVGVMPKEFNFYPKQAELWVLITPDSDLEKKPLNSLVIGVGRLKPGVSVESAQSDLELLHSQVVRSAPPDSWVAKVEPLVDPLQTDLTWLAGRNLRQSLFVLLAAVSLVLLIACVNVANLLLSRGAQRQKDLAIRFALGASRRRLIRQLLTESVLMSMLGAIPGVMLAVIATRYLRTASPVELPPGNAVVVDVRVLGFAIVVSVMTGLVFGAAPAWKASRLDVNETLKASGKAVLRGVLSNRIGRALIVFEVGLSLMLLVGAFLLVESLMRFGNAPLGFKPDRLFSARIDLPSARYPDRASQERFYDSLSSTLRLLPNVDGVAMAASIPFSGAWGTSTSLSIEGRSDTDDPRGGSETGTDVISAEYFDVMGIPLLGGRAFDAGDRAGSPRVVVVNAAFVQRIFGNENPIGRRIKLGKLDSDAPWLTVVGVVADEKRTTVYKELDYIEPPLIYQPMSQEAAPSTAIIIHGTTLKSELTAELSDTVNKLDNGIPVYDAALMNERLHEFLSPARFRAALLGSFAGMAILLAAVGLYGVLSESVSQRTREIGVRVALGATRRNILALVVGQGLRLTVMGVVAGLLGSVALTRLIASLLYDVKPADPFRLMIVAIAMVSVAILASYLPARRATRVDPLSALRCE